MHVSAWRFLCYAITRTQRQSFIKFFNFDGISFHAGCSFLIDYYFTLLLFFADNKNVLEIITRNNVASVAVARFERKWARNGALIYSGLLIHCCYFKTHKSVKIHEGDGEKVRVGNDFTATSIRVLV